MRNGLWDKRIPTLLGVVLIVIGITATSFLVQTGVITIGKAGPSETPENIRITNIADTSFTVSYTTQDSVLGSVSYGESMNLGNIAVDDRDQQSGNIKSYKIHYISVRNLKPSMKYYFTITSGQKTFSNNSNPFEVVTAKNINSPPSSQQPIVGKLILPDGTIPSESVVYLTTGSAQALSTLVKEDGSYIIPLNSLLNKDLTGYFSFSENSVIKMLITGTMHQSNVTVFAKQTNPVPIVTLSKDYDFTTNDFSPGSSEHSSASAQVSFPSFSATSNSSKDPQILTPKEEEAFSDQQPLFKGVASPGATVKIIIHSPEEIQAQVKSDSAGKWIYRPDTKLSPGEHTIAITTQDKFGILKTITQSFTVYAEGTQVSQSATPSATPVITLTSTPTPSLTLSLTPIPTFVLSPTPIPTTIPIPTSMPTPTQIIAPPTKGGLPPPGSSSAIIMGIGALAAMGTGAFLFFMTRRRVPSL